MDKEIVGLLQIIAGTLLGIAALLLAAFIIAVIVMPPLGQT